MNKRQRARAELKEKDKMAGFADKKISVWYSKVVRTVPGQYGYTMKSELKKELEERLERVYRYISRNFLPDGMVDSSNPTIKDMVEKIRVETVNIYKGRIAKQAGYIISTAEKIINKSIIEAIEQIKEDENEPTKKAVQRIARRLIRKRFANKVKGDAVTETNWIVEAVKRYHIALESEVMEEAMEAIASKLLILDSETKDDNEEDDGKEEMALLLLLLPYSRRTKVSKRVEEVQRSREKALKAIRDREVTGTQQERKVTSAVAGIRAVAKDVKQKIKEWVGIIDNVIRPTHYQVSGTKKKFKEAFMVGAYLMQYPGDDSLGAGPEEIINCRCSLIYE